jgi:hypothetical protein
MNISVVLPIYKKNSLVQIVRVYNSIVNQLFYINELVIIYDGHVNSEIKNFFTNKKKVVIIANFKNIGLGLTLRKAILKCKSNIIIRVDADDINKHDRFKKLIKTYINKPTCAVIGSYLIEMHSYKYLYRELPTSDSLIRLNLNIRNPINHPTVILNKKILIKSGNYENCPYFEDYLLWLKIKKNNGRFLNLRDLLVSSPINNDFYLRRFGINYFKHYKNFIKICYKKKLINIFFIFIMLILRYCIYLNFNFLKFFYKHLLRKFYN